MDTEVRPFGIEFPNLITLLGQHLYSEPDVFIREVIQNYHDSIVARKVHARSASPAPRIDIDIDSKSRRLSVSDNGKGLTKTEIIEDLAMIGGSGTDKLRRELRDGVGQYRLSDSLESAFSAVSSSLNASLFKPSLRMMKRFGGRAMEAKITQ